MKDRIKSMMSHGIIGLERVNGVDEDKFTKILSVSILIG
jgi:hypothetical protein